MRSVSKIKGVTKVTMKTTETKEGRVNFDLLPTSEISDLPAALQADIEEMNDIMREINSLSDKIASREVSM